MPPPTPDSAQTGSAPRVFAFDVDGVLIRPWGFREALTARGITAEMTRPFFQEEFHAALVGQVDVADLLPPWLARWGWDGILEEFLTLWLESERDFDARFSAAVTALGDRGVTCIVTSSQERRRARYLEETMAFGELFDACYFSCDLGASKPDPRYYAAVTERAGQLTGGSAPDIWFWDDGPANVAAAREAGWTAFLCESFDDFAPTVASVMGPAWG